MKYKLLFHPAAVEDLKEAINWYEKISPKLAQNLKAELKRCFSLIEQNPLMYQVYFQKFRYCFLKKFPYKIAFYVENNTVFILAIFHKFRSEDFLSERSDL